MTSYDTLVISGGAIKVFYLLGALQSAYDKKLLENITTYVGTSAGAMLSYLLCIGYSPIEILLFVYTHQWLEKQQALNVVSLIEGEGATTFSYIHDGLEKLTINKIGKFLTLGKLREEFGKTLICTSYNMTTCKLEYLGPDTYPDLPCLTALRMTANVPILFSRFKYMDSYYVDGGLVDNFPVTKAEEIGTRILGINLEINKKELQDNVEDGVLALIMRLIQIPSAYHQQNKLDRLDVNKSTIISIKTGINEVLSLSIKSKQRLDYFSVGYTQFSEGYIRKIDGL